MNLLKLISSTEIIKTTGWLKDIEIEQISISSREKGKNILFIAQKGENFDGHKFIDEAIINGAVALVLEHPMPLYNTPQIIVKNTRKAYATLASEFYENPKNKLKFIGITGTNGKTSCALFMSKILENAGKKCAVIGTLGAFANGKEYQTNLTTPDPLVLNKLLAEFVRDNIEYVSMECSAHALYLSKIYNINFEVGIITNITQDHLDFFKTMDNYAHAKLDWFKTGKIKYGITNIDDKYCRSLLKTNAKILTYGLYNPADAFAIDISKTAKGTSYTVNLLDNVVNINTNLVGEFNIYNCLAVATGAICLGINFNIIADTINNLEAPKGRFNIIDLGENKTIVVDFAHTPDSLEKALKSAREVCKGELFSIFGCGGDRDKLKRPIMGAISEKNADFTIITSDNPRFENADKILGDIEKGFKGHNYFKISDRKLAIRKIVTMLKPNDIAVLCGKGGELYQDINGIKIPYNDFDEIHYAVKEIFGENSCCKLIENI